MSGTAHTKVEALVERLVRWAPGHRDVRAVTLVGSWAYGAPGPDSDVDVVLLTDAPERYIDTEEWLEELGGGKLVKTQPWGAITERRFVLPSGLEVELDVGCPSWAAVAPLDEGTRRVATDGMSPLYDPDGLLARLLERCRQAESASGHWPSKPR